MIEEEREHDEPVEVDGIDRAEYLDEHRKVMREIDTDYYNRPGRGGWAPADFEYECPAARRGP